MAVQRLLVVLDPPMKNTLKEMAKKRKVSISSIGRDLIREALETQEDLYWDKTAAVREKNFNWSKGLKHEHVWERQR